MAAPSGSAPDARARAEVAEFLGSPRATPFLADRAGAGEVARAFLEICYGDLATRPDHLDDEQLREALDLLPARLDPSVKSSKDAVAIVRALLDHLFERRPNANSWKFAPLLDDASESFARRLEREGGSGVAPSSAPITRPGSKLGRNDPCPCGSGRKWKKCCGKGS